MGLSTLRRLTSSTDVVIPFPEAKPPSLTTQEAKIPPRNDAAAMKLGSPGCKVAQLWKH